MSQQCQQPCPQEGRITALETRAVTMLADLQEIKWLVRIGLGGMFTLTAFLLKSKLGW